MNALKETSPRIIWSVLLIWLVYFSARGVQFAFIDSYAPLIFSGFLGLITIAAYVMKGRARRKAIKLFGLILILYSIIKASLGLLLKFAPVNSVHASESASIAYFLLTGLILTGGLYLFKVKMDDQEKGVAR